MSQPETIVLLRSGRHLARAVDSLRSEHESDRIVVVTQPGTTAVLDAAAIPNADRIVYDSRPAFSAIDFVSSESGHRVSRLNYDRLAVLWTDPDGHGLENVNRTALALSPAGFVAIMPDGTSRHVGPWQVIRREVVRCGWSLLALTVFGIGILLPGAALRTFKR